MKKKIPLFLALIFGLLAAILAYVYLQKQRTSLGTIRTYLIASKQTAKGQKFTNSNISKKQMPETLISGSGTGETSCFWR